MTDQNSIHPWWYVNNEIKDRWRTQKQFADLLWKKVSEINELINGKRNITIQRDLLLAAAFGDEEWRWVHIQNQYDFYLAKMSIDSRKFSEIKRKKNLIHKEDVFNKF